MDEQQKPTETVTPQAPQPVQPLQPSQPTPAPKPTGVEPFTWKWHATVLGIITAFLILFYIAIRIFLPKTQ